MTIARTYALIIGWVMTVVGIVGLLVSGGATVLGGSLLIFDVNIVHNLVHLATGMVALFFGYYMAGRYSRAFDQWLGIVYAIITVVGVATAGFAAVSIFGLLPINLADNGLHLVLSLTALAAGFLTRKDEMKSSDTALPRAA